MSTKVRIACRRCRAKRIKCDGAVPGCSNCQKAGEACVDVDGRNNALSIPRDFAANARLRIEWLEEQLRRVAPAIDLSDGPKVDFSFLDAGSYVASIQCTNNSPDTSEGITTSVTESSIGMTPSIPPKRGHASLEDRAQEQPFTTEARSVALDLGLLTLNSDSRQMRYLGTSSGRLFTSLIGLVSPEISTRARNSRTPSIPSQLSPSGKLGPFAHTKRLKESSCSGHWWLEDRDIVGLSNCTDCEKTLPSREDAEVLLEIYFREIHVDHPFLHPGSLIDALDALYQCAAADSALDIGHNGWLASIEPFQYNGEYELSRNWMCTPVSVFTATFHVFMVFTLAATVRTRQRMYDFAPDQFYRVALSAAQHCFLNTSVATLQAVLLLAVHSLLTPTEMNIWTLTYTAMGHCVDLGLHRTATGDENLSITASLVRRMVFYCVYHLDRSVATIQGRPLGIRDESFDVTLPTLEDIQADSANNLSKDFAPEIHIPSVVRYSLHRFKLDPIISEIKLLFYHLPSQINVYTWPTDHRSAQGAIRNRLEEWCRRIRDIGGPVSSDSNDQEQQLERRKCEMKLQSQFFAAMILLYQPSQTIPQPSDEALLICYQCAASRLHTYNHLYNTDSFLQSWRSVQGIFSSGATMIYCLWTSTLVQASIPLSSSMSDLRTCTNLLSVGGEWWPSVKRGKETFGRAMDALLKKLDVTQHQNRKDLEVRQLGKRQADLPLSRSAIETSEGSFIPSRELMESDHPLPEIYSPFQSGIQGPSQPGHVTTDFLATEWSALDSGNSIFHHDAHNSTASMFDADLEATDSTVEAFIAEFLRNDTAWNPF